MEGSIATKTQYYNNRSIDETCHRYKSNNFKDPKGVDCGYKKSFGLMCNIDYGIKKSNNTVNNSFVDRYVNLKKQSSRLVKNVENEIMVKGSEVTFQNGLTTKPHALKHIPKLGY